MLLEQFGGANGELAAAMQYSVQDLNCDNPERKDLLMDIGTDELSHPEIRVRWNRQSPVRPRTGLLLQDVGVLSSTGIDVLAL